MKLKELETTLGISFPKRFHEIYESGAMKWLDMNEDEIINNKEYYINDAKAFLMINCACEPYSFYEIPKAIETLKEWINWQQEDRNIAISDRITLIPFGHSSGGDMYCFLYSDQSDEPMIILYYHDEYGNPPIIGHDFDEFLYVQVLDAVDNEEDIHGDNFQEQLLYLNDKYRDLIMGKDIDQLTDDFYSLVSETANIWC